MASNQCLCERTAPPLLLLLPDNPSLGISNDLHRRGALFCISIKDTCGVWRHLCTEWKIIRLQQKKAFVEFWGGKVWFLMQILKYGEISQSSAVLFNFTKKQPFGGYEAFVTNRLFFFWRLCIRTFHSVREGKQLDACGAFSVAQTVLISCTELKKKTKKKQNRILLLINLYSLNLLYQF